MKLLRNPVVVGVLAVLAVAFVVHAFLPLMHRGRPAPTPDESGESTPAVPAEPAPASDSSPSASRQTGGTTATGHADWSSLSNRYAGGAESAVRDPFHMRESVTNETSDTQMLLTLNAIWKSSSSTLAVINNRVVANGDKIQNFQVETIEADRVWVLGPNGREEIHFKSMASTPVNPSAGRSAGPVLK